MNRTLRQVLDYIIDNEETSYEECGKPKDHIYLKALKVKTHYTRPICENIVGCGGYPDYCIDCGNYVADDGK